MEAVNNFRLVESIIKDKVVFNEGDYLYCFLYLRKKDQTTTFGNKNNSARLIKSYCFFNIEQFNSKEEEIIKICELFKCRAGINLNKRNERDVAYELLENLAGRLKSNNYKGINGILNTTNGSVSTKDKFWLIDVDDKNILETIIEVIGHCAPYDKEKVIKILPTYSGFHIISERFDRGNFDKLLKLREIENVDVHKNNPSVLYYPSK